MELWESEIVSIGRSRLGILWRESQYQGQLSRKVIVEYLDLLNLQHPTHQFEVKNPDFCSLDRIEQFPNSTDKYLCKREREYSIAKVKFNSGVIEFKTIYCMDQYIYGIPKDLISCFEVGMLGILLGTSQDKLLVTFQLETDDIDKGSTFYDTKKHSFRQFNISLTMSKSDEKLDMKEKYKKMITYVQTLPCFDIHSFPYFIAHMASSNILLCNYANIEVLQHLMLTSHSLILCQATKPLKTLSYKGKPQ